MINPRDLYKKAEMLYANSCTQSKQHLWYGEDNSIEIYSEDDENHIYIPSKTAAVFHKDNSFVKLVLGPYGSGKSTMCLMEIVKRTCNMPYWSSGRRRAKWAIVRNTSGELYSTTLQTWLAWFGELGDIRKRQKPLLTYEHIFNDGKGLVELELIFIALDREEDIRKIKSLEVTGCYINELSEVPQNALSHLKGRLNGRYPSPGFCKEKYWTGIIADTNPPDIDHWIYKEFELEKPDSYTLFHQPPGLIKNEEYKWVQNPLCDNYVNLSSDYYTKLAEGQTQDFVKVYCLGEYGIVGIGKKVYPEYNDDIHSVEDIKPIENEPIYLGFDFGLTPACVVLQISERGQVRVLKDYFATNMGIRTFAQNIVLPSLSREFPTNTIGMALADPSGIKGDEIMQELSCIGELNSLGITTNPARTNNLDPRIGAVRYFLNTLIDGKPGFIVSRKGAPNIRKGFVKDYVYKRIAVAGEERYRDIPDKNNASHTQDALQYIMMEFAADCIAEKKEPKIEMNMYNPMSNIF